MEIESGKGVYRSEGMKPEEGKSVESTDRGLFDFMKKKEDDQMASEFENKVHVSSEAGEDHHKKKHEGLVEKIHRSDGSNSSSSDEGEGDDDEKRRGKKEKKEKKKGLKEKIMEKLPGHEDELKMEHQHQHHREETNVPVEKVHHEELHSSHANKPPQEAEEKKGFLDKIKEKLPGQQKKADGHEHQHVHVHEVTPVAAEHHEAKEKKGILEKIKEKIPGFHSKNAAEEKKDTPPTSEK
ncbi:hypothetical protein Cgig2_023104 [Carnegiea gigantea]|uniref:Dehydrin n=1 Tax=Carnegiea gigantea TaxID=171969 RepID=A0A9Q1GKG7_9CARY|nr:hypothetical protein Cgig2_023104 [Carnegiea gigantea]